MLGNEIKNSRAGEMQLFVSRTAEGEMKERASD